MVHTGARLGSHVHVEADAVVGAGARLGTRVTVGAGARYVGPWYADNANRLRAAGRTVWDASVAYRLPFGEIALYGRNLGDALYADWTGGAADQFVLGAPRSVELTLKVNL